MSATSSKHYKVLVLGAGYVSHPLLDYMTKHNDTDVTVASSIPSEIKSLSGKFKHTSPIVLDIELETERLEELVKGHDLVISLLPYSFHPKVADLCIGHKKNLVTASYVSDPIKERHQKAVDSGIGILMEMGLDPGIDHMLAMEAFDDIKGNNGKVTSFISYCGGLPAPELSSNPLKYKFSWSPAGVLMATLAPSKYLRDNQIIKHKEGGENYRNGVLPIDFMPGFNLEGLANRDSTSYKDKYGLYDCETLLRGTLRYKGSADVIVGLLNLGIITLDPHPLLTKQSPDITWKQFLGNLLANRQDMSGQELRDCVFETVGRSETRLKAIKELGLMSDEFVEKAKTPIHTLANHLNNILSYGKGERDMIILRHEIEGSYADKNEKRDIDMVIYGDPDKYSAMAKCVGYPCAIAARMMLLGKIEDKGVVTPMRKDIYQPLLEELRQLGITSKTSFK